MSWSGSCSEKEWNDGTSEAVWTVDGCIGAAGAGVDTLDGCAGAVLTSWAAGADGAALVGVTGKAAGLGGGGAGGPTGVLAGGLDAIGSAEVCGIEGVGTGVVALDGCVGAVRIS